MQKRMSRYVHYASVKIANGSATILRVLFLREKYFLQYTETSAGIRNITQDIKQLKIPLVIARQMFNKVQIMFVKT